MLVASCACVRVQGAGGTPFSGATVRVFKDVAFDVCGDDGWGQRQCGGFIQFELQRDAPGWQTSLWEVLALSGWVDDDDFSKCRWLQFVRRKRVDKHSQPVLDEVFSASGTFKRTNEWYLDVLWTENQEVFYDDCGLHNKTATEMSIFDAPSLVCADDDVENKLEFETYLVCGDTPVWRVRWQLADSPTVGAHYTSITGGAAKEFAPAFQVQDWLLGYATCTPGDVLADPVRTPALASAACNTTGIDPAPETSSAGMPRHV